jgi:hypothetical protein
MISKIAPLSPSAVVVCFWYVSYFSYSTASQVEKNYHFSDIQERKKMEQTAAAIAEKIGENIDTSILHIDPNASCRTMRRLYFSTQKMNSLNNPYAMMEELNKIAVQVELQHKEYPTISSEIMVSKAIEKHCFLKAGIERLGNYYAASLKKSTGLTLDEIYSGNKSNLLLYSPMRDIIHTKGLEKYAVENKLYNKITAMPYDKKIDDIHYILLTGHKGISIYDNQLLFSADSTYLRAQPFDGSSIVWNTHTGMKENISLPESSIVWQRQEEFSAPCTDQRVLSLDGNYLVTPGLALAYGTS